jgi:hypothetical protein
MRKKYICTYFNENFINRGCALIDSIYKTNENFVLYILALDDVTYNYLSERYISKDLVILSMSNYSIFFKINTEKYSDKKQFFFSITPNLCQWITNEYSEVDILLYLDADVYLFSDLEPIYNEFNGYSIGTCSHRHNKLIKKISSHYGKFNVGVNLFRNDIVGKKCISDWKKDCDDWYPNKPNYPLSYFSDQIFLDEWPQKYKDYFLEIKNIGVNVAPWNAFNYKFKSVDSTIYVNNEKLIIYHFSSLVKVENDLWNVNSGNCIFTLNKELRKLYEIYIKHILSFSVVTEKIIQLETKGSFKKKIFHLFIGSFLKNKIYIKNA